MDTVKVGLLHSITGTMSISESPLIDAELLAIEDINNSGGVLGRKIEYVIEDGCSDPVVFGEKAEKLINTDQVLSIFGGWNSHTRKSVKAVVEKYNNLFWYPMQYEGLEESPNIIYTGTCLNQQILSMLEWCDQKGWRKYYLIGSDYIYPKITNKLISAVLQREQAEILQERYVALGGKDFSVVFDDILHDRPDVIINTLNGDSNLHFFHEFCDNDLSAKDIPVVSTSIAEQECLGMIEYYQGHYSCWSYFQSLKNTANAAFVKKYKERFGQGRVLSDPAACSYSQVYMWKKLVEKACSFDVADIISVCSGECFETPLGNVVLHENHHLSKKAYIGQLNRHGQFDIVWSTDDYIEPQPWLGIETLKDFPTVHLIKEVLGKYPDVVDFNYVLDRQVRESIRELEQTNHDYENITKKLKEINKVYDSVNTKLFKSELELKAIYENAPQVMMVVSRDREILKINKHSTRFIDLEINGEAKTRLGAAIKCIHSSDSDKGCGFGPACAKCELRETINETIEKGESISNREVRVNVRVCDEMVELYFVVSTAELKQLDSDNILVCLEDITDDKKNEKLRNDYYNSLEVEVRSRTEELTRKNDELLHQIKERQKVEYDLKNAMSQLVENEKLATIGQLASGIAHEINTPLGAIGSSNSTLQSQFDFLMKHLWRFCELYLENKQLVELFIDKLASGKVEMTSRQSREVKNTIRKSLADAGVEKSGIIATFLVSSGIIEDYECFMSIFTRDDALEIVEYLEKIANIYSGGYIIDTAINQSSRIIFALKDYARSKKGEHMVETDLAETIHTALVLCCTKSKCTVDLDLEIDEEVKVLCYPNELSQVWANLIQNALQAMNNRGTLTIKICDYGNEVAVIVRDNGVGIPPEIREHIFEPLFTTKPKGVGTGLGLDIVKRIIERHKGSIDVHSEEMEGSAFIVTLPKSACL